jgi:hypothetical protein
VIEDERIWIETIRDVEPGEELAYDYAYILEERHSPAAKRRYPCSCGARNCRRTILAKKRQSSPRERLHRVTDFTAEARRRRGSQKKKTRSARSEAESPGSR